MMDWLYELFDRRTFGAARSSQFAKLSRDMIKEAGGLCRMGLHKATILNPLNTHHVLPFHEHPEYELKRPNLIVLCRFHHLWNGHLGSWKSSNAQVREDAAEFTTKVKARP